MGRALEILTGQVTNPGATVTALTANAGDSFTVRAASQGSAIRLLQSWAFTTTNMLERIRSPRMHDQAQNMRLQPAASQPFPLLPWGGEEPLRIMDPITVELTGGAAETDAASLLVYYEDLPGSNSQLYTPAEVDPLIEHMTTVEVDLTSSATTCNYSGTVALNGTFDTLIRDRQYAVVGYECGTNGLTLGIRGADTGNLRVGGPLLNLPFLTSNWFYRISNESGLPLVPVINSANVAAVLLDCVAQAASTAFKVGVHLALLREGALATH